MPKRQDPGIAVQDVECSSEKAEYEYQDGKGCERQQYRHDGQANHQQQQLMALNYLPPGARMEAHTANPAGCSSLRHPGFHAVLTRAKRPLGLKRRTPAISMYRERSANSGANSVVMLTTSPARHPAMAVPAREPIPPRTVTTKASASTLPPISGLAPRIGAARVPANKANAVPRPKVLTH